MCGIIGAVGNCNIVPFLLNGINFLQYRGYDSSGIAIISDDKLKRLRCLGGVDNLKKIIYESKGFCGTVGIGHTRWATHGIPSKLNAHPHVFLDKIAIVHNGIIENYEEIKEKINFFDHNLKSSTDTEIVLSFIYEEINKGKNIICVLQSLFNILKGSFSFGIIDTINTSRLIGLKMDCPLVVGISDGKYFLSSDSSSISNFVKDFVFLENGDVAEVYSNKLIIYDYKGNIVTRKIYSKKFKFHFFDKNGHDDFMHKEIHDQPDSLFSTMKGRLSKSGFFNDIFGYNSDNFFKKIKFIHIIACGTSYHAGLVAKNWFEDIVKIPCFVDVASEFRYKNFIFKNDILFIVISQSGETADVLKSLKYCKKFSFNVLCICNVEGSSITRESDFIFLTKAGIEISVATTKGFTTQLISLLMLCLSLSKKLICKKKFILILREIQNIPYYVEKFLKLEVKIKKMSKNFLNEKNILLVGRNILYPIVMECSLKLKEIAYIHAESFFAGELKHGPLALVDNNLSILFFFLNDFLFNKFKSTLMEVQSRGGNIYIFCSDDIDVKFLSDFYFLTFPSINKIISPVLYTVVVQIFSYYVAFLKGKNVDAPRNLAKSVTVE